MSTHNPPHRKASGRGIPGKNFIANASTSSRQEGKANERGPLCVQALCSFLGPSMVPTVPLLFIPPNSRQVTSSWLRGGGWGAGWVGYPEPWLYQRQGALLGQTWVARSPLCSLKFFL